MGRVGQQQQQHTDYQQSVTLIASDLLTLQGTGLASATGVATSAALKLTFHLFRSVVEEVAHTSHLLTQLVETYFVKTNAIFNSLSESSFDGVTFLNSLFFKG